MEWKDLSNKAKNIIEWVENPYTNKRLTLTVNKNSFWIAWGIKIYVTEKIFSEIQKYVNSDPVIKVVENLDDKLVFRLK